MQEIQHIARCCPGPGIELPGTAGTRAVNDSGLPLPRYSLRLILTAGIRYNELQSCSVTVAGQNR